MVVAVLGVMMGPSRTMDVAGGMVTVRAVIDAGLWPVSLLVQSDPHRGPPNAARI